MPRPTNPLPRIRSTGPASSACPDRLSARTTCVTSGDSSGAQAYSLRAAVVNDDTGTRCARRRPARTRGRGVQHTDLAAVVHSRQPRHGSGAQVRDLLLPQVHPHGTALLGERSCSVSRSSPSTGGSVAAAERAVDSVSRTPVQSSPVRCQTVASVSRVSASPSSVARYAGRHSAHGVR